MAIRYQITSLPDGKYKSVRASTAGKTSAPLSLDRSDLEIYLKDSVSKERLEDALRTLDTLGGVTVEADLETT